MASAKFAVYYSRFQITGWQSKTGQTARSQRPRRSTVGTKCLGAISYKSVVASRSQALDPSHYRQNHHNVRDSCSLFAGRSALTPILRGANAGHRFGLQIQRPSRSLQRGAKNGNAVTSARSSVEYESLKGVQVLDASSGRPVDLLSLWKVEPGTRVVVPFMTHFADLSSWEFAQKLVKKLPALQANGVRVMAVGLGSPDNARRFAKTLNFPLALLYADPTGECYRALGYSPGFAPDADVSPYLKLLPMLMGIGSPGTIQEVARGYFGDRDSKPVFDGETPFDILGRNYQRPMELATLRLFNMVGILQKWGEMSPPETRLLTQQGGALVFDGKDVVFSHVDSGILKYADVDALVAAAVRKELPVSAM